MRLGSWLVAAASVHRGLALRGERWALRSDETEADGACTEATLLSRARFATSPTVTRCHTLRERLCRRGDIVGKLVSKEVIVGNQMRVAGESLTLSSARREYGLVAGDQSAARLARVIIGHVGGDVHTETVARELVVHS